MSNFKIVDGYKYLRYSPQEFSEEETLLNSETLYKQLQKRRSVRDFSDKTIPKEVINNLIKSASTAPSGANKQPWTFCVI